MEENTKEMIVIDSVDRYNEIFGLETKHPLVSIIDLTKATTWPTRAWFRYEVYALFLKNVKCGDIKYGRQYYDYQDGTIVCFGPGQITDLELIQNIQPNAHGLLFHPDLIRGTSLGQEIKNYSFFSYETNEALHLSEEEQNRFRYFIHKLTGFSGFGSDLEERAVFTELMVFLNRIFYSKSKSGELPLDAAAYHTQVDDILTFINQNIDSQLSIDDLSSHFYLSSSYLCRIFKAATGTTINKYITAKRITVAKSLLSTGYSVTETCERCGFNDYSNFLKAFTKAVGISPKKYAQCSAS